LEEFAIHTTEEQLKQIVERQKTIADSGQPITTSDLLSIASEIIKNKKFNEKFKLNEFHIVTGLNIIPTAVVKLNIHEKDFIASDTGVGPVDAALKAIQTIANEIANIKIREYKLDSITGGSDASAEVSVKVEDKEGNIISSRKSGKDIVVTSVQAVIDAINTSMLKKIIHSDMK
jgi:2-isopropylmalate synthase